MITLTPQTRSLALILGTFFLLGGLFFATLALPFAQQYLHIDLGPYGAVAAMGLVAVQTVAILIGMMGLHRQNPLLAFFICLAVVILALYVGFIALDAKEHKNAADEPTSGKMMHL